MEPQKKACMYFIALLCPEELDKKITTYKNWMFERFGTKVALKSPAHITLIPPFWISDAEEEKLVTKFKSFGSGLKEIKITLKDFNHFRKRVIYINVEESPSLNQLKTELNSFFAREPVPVLIPDDRPFKPHVTIATRDLKPGAFFKAWAHFSQVDFKASFISSRIHLLRKGELKWEPFVDSYWNPEQPGTRVVNTPAE